MTVVTQDLVLRLRISTLRFVAVQLVTPAPGGIGRKLPFTTGRRNSVFGDPLLRYGLGMAVKPVEASATLSGTDTDGSISAWVGSARAALMHVFPRKRSRGAW